MDETQGPGHHFAPGLFEDYCQIFNWQLISASIEAVSKSLVLGVAGYDRLAVVAVCRIMSLRVRYTFLVLPPLVFYNA